MSALLKQRIANQFSRAAANYDAIADVQEEIAKDALLLLPNSLGSNLLDIGCGTGRITRLLTEYSAQVTGLDISQGMLKVAKTAAKNETIEWIGGDAEKLPFAGEQFDRLFSTMVLQWCDDPECYLKEVFRVCQPDGVAVLAIMSAGSLFELKESWLEVDNQQHVNQFPERQIFTEIAKKVGFHARISEKTYTTWHVSIRDVLHSIKDIGASVVNRDIKAVGLLRKQLQDLEQVYAMNFGRENKLPLTYKVTFLELRK